MPNTKIQIDESGLKRFRYGEGSQPHNLSLMSWEAVKGIAPAGTGQYGSAVVDLAVYVLDAIVNPSQPRLRVALQMILAGMPHSMTLLTLASNLESLAEHVRLMAMEQPEAESGEDERSNGKDED